MNKIKKIIKKKNLEARWKNKKKKTANRKTNKF